MFFGAGTLFNRDGREYLVKAFPVSIRYDSDDVHLACFFPMPFFNSARFEIGGADVAVANVRWSVRHMPLEGTPEHYAYLHATYRDHGKPVPGSDLVLLDTNCEGSEHWSGSFIGTTFVFSHNATLTTLEGDPRFFFDDSESSQAYGTGTEEWGGGGDYWGGLNMTLPFAGHPVGARKLEEAVNDEDKIESAYRFLLGDLFPFGKHARIQLEHGGVNESTEHYKTVAYWYGSPKATIIKTDELRVGDSASEQAHHYHSPEASAPYGIKSRYELGPDQLPPNHPPAASPFSIPPSFVEYEFEAEPGTYAIWLLGRALEESNTTDASWLQFDEHIGTDRAGAYSHEKGFGNWLDRFPPMTWAWSSALPQEPPRTITFEKPGRHRLRVQPRHVPHNIATIWLSRSRLELPPPDMTPTSGPGEIVLRVKDQKKTVRVSLSVDAPNRENAFGFDGGSFPLPNPPHYDQGRKTRGTSEFTLKLDPKNIGVMLRRKLDYQFPNQRAEVFITDPTQGTPASWQSAGVWYLAGSNTCVYSNPKAELGATEHHVQTSNRRFRQDEFLVPRALTEGRSEIRVRIKFTSVETPLFPGHPVPELAWSEIRYDA
ncbi:MAG TPA: DUF2961 domain-containing protein, partial [Candidatus Kapabacteria bacterium]|nr:DUF2961 domain-containing protein [Candidatus Kapabacteria bacterium]